MQAALPAHRTEIQIVGIVDGLDEGWATLQETPTDLLVVACTAAIRTGVLFMIEVRSSSAPTWPVVVFVAGPPDGFVRRVFEAGADDIVRPPDGTPRTSPFASQKAMARKRRRERRHGHSALAR